MAGLDAAGRKAGGGGGETVALLHAKLGKSAHARLALGESGKHGEHRIFIDHARRTLRRHVDTAQRAGPHAEIGRRLATFKAKVEQLDVSAHVADRLDEACARRVHQHAFEHDVGALADQACGDGEGG